ncbi:MAG: phosphoribosylamine--glycine ligase [Spirochaetia bacterium]
MKVLVIGSGAREHALCWVLAQSKYISQVYAAPGNAGISDIGQSLPATDPLDGRSVAKAAESCGADFIFMGPEAPCAQGVVDALLERDIPVIGPPQESARLESSKTFSKEFLFRHNIPTAQASMFSSFAEFEAHIKNNAGKKLVVKQSGLAAGKGVLESDKTAELLAFGNNILKSDSLLVEEYLTGWEVSVFALSDGRDYKLLAPCTDFKKAHDNDTGPNTGGMGSICPVPTVDDTLWEKIKKRVVSPTFEGLSGDGLNYRGVLYFGLMITADGPKVLEYNIRWGDPEAQVLLPMIDTDFGLICKSLLDQELDRTDIRMKSGAALGVVVAAAGYPGSYTKGIPITGLPTDNNDRLLVFHASTGRNADGTVRTGGGRCFTVVGRGPDLRQASELAYSYADQIRFEGAWYRSDIGKKFITGDSTL